MHPTPLRVEQDRGDFVRQNQLQSTLDLEGGAGDGQAVGRQDHVFG